jgi:hypothetical protein
MPSYFPTTSFTSPLASPQLPESTSSSAKERHRSYSVVSDATAVPNAIPSAHWFNELSASTSRHESKDVRNKLNMLRAFVSEPMLASIQHSLISSDLLGEVLRVAIRANSYFPRHHISLRQNTSAGVSHKFEVWVRTGDDLDAELDALDLLDTEWLILEPEKLRQNVLILLE